MKPTTKHTLKVPQSQLRLAIALSFGFLSAGALDQAKAVTVDSEIVLLVDAARPGLSTTNHNRLMNSYATAFTNTQILNSIQSGSAGRIAVSLMFYGTTSSQRVGIPWMMIGNLSEAQSFASMLTGLAMPTTLTGTADVGSALTAATRTFGTETGNPGNGFESAVQIIEVATTRSPINRLRNSAITSSDNSLASGVDLINSMILGANKAAVNSFYQANVIGSTIDGVNATSSISPLNTTLATSMRGRLAQTVQGGASTSIAAIPEPSTWFAMFPAALLIWKRRRI